MNSALAHDTRALALELHQLLAELDRSRFRWREFSSPLRARLTQLRTHLGELTRREDEAGPLRGPIDALRDAVESHAPASDGRREWLAFRAQILPAYESLAAALRASSIHVPSLRPKNYVRNAYHVASAAGSLALLEMAPSWTIVIAVGWAFAASAWTMELTRRLDPRINTLLMRLFGPVAHPHEAHRVNSGTWYVSAMAVLAMTREPVACALALTTLGAGDPVAAIVGRRWGRRAWKNGRTVEGSTAFVVASVLVGAPWVAAMHGVGLGAAVGSALAAALAGAFSELHSRHIDDNLSIPVLAWAGAMAGGALAASVGG